MPGKNEELNKVAKITVYFWIMKVVATTLGEMLGDFFSMTLNLGYIISLAVTVAFLFSGVYNSNESF